MKKICILIVVLICISTSVSAQQKMDPVAVNTADSMVVDASCGQCRLGLKGKGCDLAVRINGKAYFVDGTAIDSHGDAHANDGFCNAIRKAVVKGEVINGRFRATYFRLLAQAPKTSAGQKR
jgi:hypothetical protein